MTVYIKNARDLEKLSIQCVANKPIPQAEALLDVLRRIEPQLKKKGWEIIICNAGCNTVCWHFKRRGTCTRVCRVVHITPIAHYPIKLEPCICA